MIEVRQARYFEAVAEELHFGRAAERLRMSQPPLSQAIRQLERQLGVQLLTRSSRSVSLTDAGQVLLEHCRSLIAAADRAAAAALQAQAGAVGVLRIAAVTSAFTEVLPRILRTFQDQRPAVELRISEIDTQHGARAVLDQQIDLAVIRQSRVDPRLRSDPLRRDHLVAVVPTAHRLAATARPVDLADLADDPWVWLPREVSPGYHDELVAACRAAGFSPDARHSATSIDSQLAMVACGLGVTLAPQTSTARAPAGTALLPLRQRFDLIELSIVRRAQAPGPLVEHFLHCALQCVRGDR
jgi:DNA-binding transcriptional LysR family regulator